jgi:hypothetical protein
VSVEVLDAERRRINKVRMRKRLAAEVGSQLKDEAPGINAVKMR